MITFGNALSKARVISKKSYSWSDARSSGPRRSPCFSVHSSTPRSVPAHSGNGGTDVACSNFKNKDARSGVVPVRTFSIKPGPHVSFRPTKGLVSLFARTRTKTGGPRASITRPSAAPFGYTISYAEALVGNMDGGGLRSGEDETGRGSAAGNRGGRTNGQGSLMNHNGFRRPNFEARRGGYNRFGRGHRNKHREGMGRYDRPSSSYGFQGGTGSRNAANLPVIPSLNSAGVLGASSVDTLAQAVALLSQALGHPSENLAVPGASMIVPNAGGKTDDNSIINNGEGTSSAHVGAGKHVQKETSGKQPYCYRCLKKGHTMQGCTAKLFCDICHTEAHNSGRCPVFRGDKPGALTCGYAVDGLGFYYIPHAPRQKNKDDSHSALVRVTSGSLSQEQIASELGRLVSTKWNWEIVKT
jgi:hypothetical protein